MRRASTPIALFVSVDSSLPNLEVSDHRLIRIDQSVLNLNHHQRDQFIPEDLDPLTAPMTTSVSDPLIGSYFIEEHVSDTSDSSNSDDDESVDSIKLLKFIGRGGFGAVYTTIWSGQLVAVKLCQFDSGKYI